MGEWMRVIDMAPPARVTGIGGHYCSKGHEMTEKNTRLRFRRRDKRHGNYWERECKKCRHEANNARRRAIREAEGRTRRPCIQCGRSCLGRPKQGPPDGLCGRCRQTLARQAKANPPRETNDTQEADA